MFCLSLSSLLYITAREIPELIFISGRFLSSLLRFLSPSIFSSCEDSKDRLFLPRRQQKRDSGSFSSVIKRMAEEQRCQAPRLCANNCGFIGSPATRDLCSKCYHDFQIKEQQSSDAKIAINQTRTTCLSSPLTDTAVDVPQPLPAQPQVETPSSSSLAAAKPNRCSTCNRRIGLAGFQCRCRMMFCGSHRYPEQHACSFDFKAMGREQIFKANPVIKAPKLDKI